jgi:hypothetical protein
MNWRLFISAVLLLVLLPVSAFGQACDVRCCFGADASGHHHQATAATASAPMEKMDMHTASCHSPRHLQRDSLSHSSALCELTAQACSHEYCASDRSLLAALKSFNDQPLVSSQSPLWQTIVALVTSTPPIVFLASPDHLHRPLAILRI